jgi:4-hydroxy-2-oxoheptanedioate aldolase
MELRLNRFKRALRDGRRQIGLWTQLCSGTVAEILADSGYDWLVIDTEHAPNELPNVVEQLRALEGTRVSPIVRPAWNDPVLFKRLLDVGVQTLVVPYVQSAEEAARAVAATHYPPLGVRGVAVTHRANRYGRVKDYARRAYEEICVIVQLETRAALSQLEAIAAVEGVDALFVGPSDLSADLGHLGDNRHPDVQKVIAETCARCRSAGKPVGILAPIQEDAHRFLELGFSFVGVGSDAGVLRDAAERLRRSFEPEP